MQQTLKPSEGLFHPAGFIFSDTSRVPTETTLPIKPRERITIYHRFKWVRVWTGKGAGGQEYFTAQQYGSMKRAYNIAVLYEARLSLKIRRGRYKPREKISSRNTSGYIGVSPIKNKKGEHAGWRASWSQFHSCRRERIYRSKDFTFFQYGSSAKEKAIEYRDGMEALFMSPEAVVKSIERS